MSGKENGEGSQEDVWVVRSPLWRSPQLSPLLKRLQEKIDKQPSASSSSHPQNTRVEGEPSTHSLPTSSPAWVLLPVDRQSPERSPSQNRIPPSPQSPQHCSGDESDGEPSCICWTPALSQSEGGQTDGYSLCGTKLMPKCSLFT